MSLIRVWTAPGGAEWPPSLPHPLGKSLWFSFWELPFPRCSLCEHAIQRVSYSPIVPKGRLGHKTQNKPVRLFLQWRNHPRDPVTENNWEATPLKRLPCRPAAGPLPGPLWFLGALPHPSQIAFLASSSQTLCLLLQAENPNWSWEPLVLSFKPCRPRFKMLCVFNISNPKRLLVYHLLTADYFIL